MSSGDDGFTHVVTLRDIYDQGQRTHDTVIRLEAKVASMKEAQDDTDKDVGKVKEEVQAVNRRVGSLELDRAKVLGMAAAVAILSSGGTASLLQVINNK